MSDLMEASFGKEGSEAYREAMEAAHSFAQLTKCPFGVSVIGWLQAQAYGLEMSALKAKASLPTKQG